MKTAEDFRKELRQVNERHFDKIKKWLKDVRRLKDTHQKKGQTNNGSTRKAN